MRNIPVDKETIINIDKSKLKKTMMRFLFFCVFFLVMSIVVLSASKIKIFYVMFLGGGFLISLIVFIKILISILNPKEKIGLKLNNTGVLFLCTIAGRKAGLIKWTDVETITPHSAYNVDGFYLKLKNADKYIKPSSKKTDMFNSGIVINSSELQVSHEKLGELLSDYLSNFRN